MALQRRGEDPDRSRRIPERIAGLGPVPPERGISAIYYKWLKQFMEGGKAQLRGDTLRSATRDEVEALKRENTELKALAGEQALELSLFKKG